MNGIDKVILHDVFHEILLKTCLGKSEISPVKGTKMMDWPLKGS